MVQGWVTVIKLLLIFSIIAAWLFVNIYIFPKLGIRT